MWRSASSAAGVEDEQDAFEQAVESFPAVGPSGDQPAFEHDAAGGDRVGGKCLGGDVVLLEAQPAGDRLGQGRRTLLVAQRVRRPQLGFPQHDLVEIRPVVADLVVHVAHGAADQLVDGLVGRAGGDHLERAADRLVVDRHHTLGLTREVVRHGAAGDLCGVGDVGEGEAVETAVDGEPGGDQDQGAAGVGLLAFPQGGGRLRERSQTRRPFNTNLPNVQICAVCNTVMAVGTPGRSRSASRSGADLLHRPGVAVRVGEEEEADVVQVVALARAGR